MGATIQIELILFIYLINFMYELYTQIHVLKHQTRQPKNYKKCRHETCHAKKKKRTKYDREQKKKNQQEKQNTTIYSMLLD